MKQLSNNLSDDACILTAKNSYLGKKMSKYAHGKFYVMEEICAYAAKNGDLEMLKYAHENGCIWDEWVCAIAALGGYLQVLKYAHENGCKWDKDTCMSAALNGHLEILKYARENGCEWHKNRCERVAIHNNHTNIVEWIKNN